jgi:succinyl-CoA synthetase beta subunit
LIILLYKWKKIDIFVVWKTIISVIMNIHEYQGKAILKESGVAIPFGFVAESPEAAIDAAKKIQTQTGTDTWAVKAQIHAGGRGKGGGVKIAKSLEEVKNYAKEIIGMTLVTHQTGPEGKLVNKVLVEQGIFYPGESEIQEFYMSVLLDRGSGKNTIMYSTEGGMDIETVAEKHRSLFSRRRWTQKPGFCLFRPGGSPSILAFQEKRLNKWFPFRWLCIRPMWIQMPLFLKLIRFLKLLMI